MNILVTGTGGFLGAAIEKHLATAGHVVFPVAHRDGFFEKIDKISKDTSIDVIIHAGFSVDFSAKPATENKNISTALDLKEIFEGKDIAQFIFLSAAAVLGVSDEPMQRSEINLNTSDEKFSSWLETNYVKDKIACEKILHDISRRFCTLYLTTVYGAGMPSETRDAILKSGCIRISPPGGTSYLILSDFLASLETIIKEKVAGDYVLSSGNITYKKIFSLANEVTKKNNLIITIPQIFAKLLHRLPFKGGFLSSHAIILSTFGFKYFSPQKAMRDFHFRPRGDFKEVLMDLYAQKSQ